MELRQKNLASANLSCESSGSHLRKGTLKLELRCADGPEGVVMPRASSDQRPYGYTSRMMLYPVWRLMSPYQFSL